MERSGTIPPAEQSTTCADAEVGTKANLLMSAENTTSTRRRVHPTPSRPWRCTKSCWQRFSGSQPKPRSIPSNSCKLGQDKMFNADRFMAIVDSYTDIQGLTPEIVQEFLSRRLGCMSVPNRGKRKTIPSRLMSISTLWAEFRVREKPRD
ncbi:DUF4368 domain-containing protein [Lutispora saccharofermentans]